VPTAIEPISFEDQGWTVRYLPPDDPSTARVILMLHGWTGDEKVMWIFARALAGRFWLFAPRAPVVIPGNGYAWLPHGEQRWPTLEEFQPVTDQLIAAFDRWSEHGKLPAAARLQSFHLMGFSQGAAMSFAVAAYHPQRVERVAALAGFLPRRAEPGTQAMPPASWNAAFRGRNIYLAHGTRDEIVPVSMAYETSRKLQAAGADVTFCESDTGHKLSLNCLRGLEAFFA
jgi:phospholipase/carboxylesterase